MEVDCGKDEIANYTHSKYSLILTWACSAPVNKKNKQVVFTVDIGCVQFHKSLLVYFCLHC